MHAVKERFRIPSVIIVLKNGEIRQKGWVFFAFNKNPICFRGCYDVPARNLGKEIGTFIS